MLRPLLRFCAIHLSLALYWYAKLCVGGQRRRMENLGHARCRYRARQPMYGDLTSALLFSDAFVFHRRDRSYNERHKSSRANHNRKDGATRKLNRGMN